MIDCKEIHDRIALYLDEELEGAERAGFEAHVQSCDACHARLKSEREFLEVVRSAKPLHPASPELRGRVEEQLSSCREMPVAPKVLRRDVEYSLGLGKGSLRAFANFRTLIAASVIVVVLLFLGFWQVTREFASKERKGFIGGPSEFALMAADTHLRHVRGQLPLEIDSDAPQEISSWFKDKLPFSVKLPNYQESSGQEKLYQLEGARLVAYKSDYAAYVSYQMRDHPISLVITSNALATPSGGQEIAAKGLVFHYDSINGFKVITWADRGLTYALVSNLEERGQQSCVVCHHGTNDREFIESLKPRS